MLRSLTRLPALSCLALAAAVALAGSLAVRGKAEPVEAIESVEALSERLRSDALEERRAAAAAAASAARSGRKLRAAVPALLEAVDDPDLRVSSRALEALRRALRPKDHAEALAVLERALAHESPHVWTQAAVALLKLGRPGRQAVAAALREPDSRLKGLACLRTLDGRKPMRVELPGASALAGRHARRHCPPDPRTRRIRALAERGPKALPELLDFLDDERLWARSAAGRALGRMRLDLDTAWRPLLEATKSPHGWEVGQRLQRLVRKARRQGRELPAELVSAATALLAHEEAGPEAAGLLRVVGPAAAPAVPALIARLEEPSMLQPAAEALEAIGPEAASAIGPLAAQLNEHEEALVRDRVCGVLKELAAGRSERLASVRKPLLAATRDEFRGVRRCAMRALAPLAPGSPEVVAALKERLRDERWFHRLEAAELLVEHDEAEAEAEAEAVGALVALLEEGKAKAAIPGILEQMGPVAAPAVPALFAELAGRNEQAVREALLAIGPEAVRPRLRLALGHPDPDVAEAGRELHERLEQRPLP